MESELIIRIDHVYESLKQIIAKDNGARLLEPDFLDVIRQNDPGQMAGVPLDITKLAIIADHREWETYYQDPMPDGSGSIGDTALEVGRAGLEASGLSRTELKLMRESIVTGSRCYADTLAEVEAAKKAASDVSTADSHLMVLPPLARLGRLGDYMKHLQAVHPAIDKDPFLAITWPMKLAVAFGIDGWEPADRVDQIRDGLDLFARGGSLNDIAGIVDPIDYDTAWIHCIEMYFTSRESLGAAGPVCEAATELDSLRVGEAVAVFPGLPLEVASTLSDEEMEWIELHDSLCLETLMEHEDPASAWYSLEPYARGYRIRAWRRLMNLDFPKKNEILLEAEADRSHNPTRIMPLWRERLHSRMDLEMPGWNDEN